MELDRIKKIDITDQVDGRTDRVNSMVIVKKSDGNLRTCLAPRYLIHATKKEHYQLDTSSGYWHIEISQLLAFNTLFGRYNVK